MPRNDLLVPIPLFDGYALLEICPMLRGAANEGYVESDQTDATEAATIRCRCDLILEGSQLVGWLPSH